MRDAMTRTEANSAVMLTLALIALVWTSCSSCVDRSRPPATAPEQEIVRESPQEKMVSEQREVQRQAPPRVRKAAVAGSWYPGDPEKLKAYLDGLLARAGKAAQKGDVIALISPHAGYTFSGKAAAAGFSALKGKPIRRVVALAVSHRVPFRGASIADVTHYETPLGMIPLDRDAVKRLRRCKVVGTVAQAHLQEHSLEMQLPLLQRVLPQFSLVPVLLSRMDETAFSELAAALADIVDQHTLVVASSDFTHRGPNYSYEVPGGAGTLKERLKKLDQGSIQNILALDRRGLLSYRNQTGTTICGINPVALLLELLSHATGVKGEVLSHYTSGDISGDWRSTVTYIDIAFTGKWPRPKKSTRKARSAGEGTFPLSQQERILLLKLARSSLEAAVRKGGFDPSPLQAVEQTASLLRKAGAFVTLKCQTGPRAVCVGRGKNLRGCIGTIAPTTPVVQTVARRAASAALEDPRFPKKVGVEELPHIHVEVSVLTPPRRVSNAQDIVIGRHGIILRKGMQSATFLPQVAPEQGWDRDTTLTRLSIKAGMGPDGWRSGAEFQVYEAIVFSEKEHD